MSAVSSPCIKICTIDKALQLCTGCGRTLAEIAAWGNLSEVERQSIMANLSQRLQHHSLLKHHSQNEAQADKT
jgi:uncharacterized protein